MGRGQVVPYGFGARGTGMLVNADLVLGGKRPRRVRDLLPGTQNPHTTGPSHNRPVHTHRKHYRRASTITGSSHKRLDEIRTSETKLRQVIDTIPTLAWCNLADGPNRVPQQTMHEYTGLSPEESHGWGWQVAFHPEDLPALMEKWRELLVSGEPGEIEARLRRHDGVFRWFLIRVEPLRDPTGKVIRWVWNKH